MEIIEAIILGILQGVTEFLPVSSSAHILLGSKLLHTSIKDQLLFSVVVHAATTSSTIVVFRKDIKNIACEAITFKKNESNTFLVYLLISMIPILIVGFSLKDFIEEIGQNKLFVGAALIFTAGLLILPYWIKRKESLLTPWKAFLIGIAQAIAIFPGVSRSGSTISTALLLGIDKEKATRFSFLMMIIPILGASLLELKEYFEQPANYTTSPVILIVGFVAAFLSGLIACKWMISLVRKGKLHYFAIYCFIVGIIAILTSL